LLFQHVFSAAVPTVVYFTHKGVITHIVGFILVVAALSMFGFFESINSGCVFSYLGKCAGEKAVQLAQSGTTWDGLTIYVVRVVLKATTKQDVDGFLLTGYLQFSIIGFWMAMCAVLSLWLTSWGAEFRGKSASSVLTSINDENEQLVKHKRTSLRKLLQKSWPVIVAMTFGLVLNQTFYPGVFSILHGPRSDWFVVILFGSFAVGDTIGQSLPSVFRIYRRKWWFAYPLVQILITPLLIMAIQKSVAAFIFSNDYYAYVIAFFWGFNVGSGVCCHMMMIVEESSDKGYSSTVAVVTLQIGIIVASLCGYGVKYLLADLIPTPAVNSTGF